MSFSDFFILFLNFDVSLLVKIGLIKQQFFNFHLQFLNSPCVRSIHLIYPIIDLFNSFLKVLFKLLVSLSSKVFGRFREFLMRFKVFLWSFLINIAFKVLTHDIKILNVCFAINYPLFNPCILFLDSGIYHLLHIWRFEFVRVFLLLV